MVMCRLLMVMCRLLMVMCRLLMIMCTSVFLSFLARTSSAQQQKTFRKRPPAAEVMSLLVQMSAILPIRLVGCLWLCVSCLW